MVRTLITISKKDKEWLDRYSRQHHQSTAETIRKAIQSFRKQNNKSSYQEAIQRTAGLWKDRKIDALKYVEELREEWER